MANNQYGPPYGPPQPQYPQQLYPPQQQYPPQYPQQQYPPQQPLSHTVTGPVGRRGWSQRISTPEFQEAVRRSKKRSNVTQIIFILLPIVACLIGGCFDMDNYSAYVIVGLVLSAIVAFICLLTKISALRDKFWEGTVTEKYQKNKRRTRNHGNEEEIFWEPYNFIIVRSDNGKKFKIEEKADITAVAYHYFHKGDRVRHHAKMGLLFPYEKYDKSRDTITICPFCKHEQSIAADYCAKCHKPLLN